MENSQQTHNFFFEKISENFKSSNIDDIIKTLSVIKLLGANDLTNKQFELIGSLAYLTGIDFTGQTQKLNATTLKNVTARFESVGLTKEVWAEFIDVINILNIDNLIGPKESIKDGVKSEIAVTAELIKNKHEINQVIKNNYIPVKFAVNVDELIKTKKLTYMNLLNFNSMVYEQIPLRGASIAQVINLFKNKKFTDLMGEASIRFDNQKFALIYFDSLISLMEFNAQFKINYDVLFNQTLIETLETEEKELAEKAIAFMKKVDDLPEEVPAEQLTKASEIEIDDTDFFLKASLEESLERKINSLEDLVAAFELVAENEDLMQHVYRYIRANVSKNRTPLNEVFNFTKEEIVTYFKEYLAKTVSEYNELVKSYIQPIPENIFGRIINAINDTVRALSITKSESKGYLIQQLYENQITTYKQLHQTIDIIEGCDIDGNKLNTYVALRDMIMYSEDIVNIFEDSIKLEDLKLKLQYYTAVKDFFENKEAPEMVETPAK